MNDVLFTVCGMKHLREHGFLHRDIKPGNILLAQDDDGRYLNIRKTCRCNKYSLKPHFYIVKLGYAGVYLFFGEAVITCTHNLCFEQK